jgi:hypothetical protein
MGEVRQGQSDQHQDDGAEPGSRGVAADDGRLGDAALAGRGLGCGSKGEYVRVSHGEQSFGVCCGQAGTGDAITCAGRIRLNARPLSQIREQSEIATKQTILVWFYFETICVNANSIDKSTKLVSNQFCCGNVTRNETTTIFTLFIRMNAGRHN